MQLSRLLLAVATIAFGYCLRRLGLVDVNVGKSLLSVIFNSTLPCVLLMTFASLTFDSDGTSYTLRDHTVGCAIVGCAAQFWDTVAGAGVHFFRIVEARELIADEANEAYDLLGSGVRLFLNVR